MLEKSQWNTVIEWFKPVFPYISTIGLSMWGGAVNYIRVIRMGKKKFQWKELCFDLLTSSFAGLLTYHLCQSAHIDPMKSAVLIAISGHMGTRAIAGFEEIYKRLIGKDRNV